MRIAICDDESIIAEDLYERIQRILKKWNVNANIDLFNNGLDLLYEIETKGIYDIIYLDIEIGDINGIELAAKLNSDEYYYTLILISQYEIYYRAAFEVQPFWFLDKPFDDGKIELSLDGKLLNFRGKKGKELMRDFDYTYIYSVSDMGVWYSITIVYNGHLIKFLDSAKLLPFTLAEIGKAFGTKYQKLEMDYSSHDCDEDIPFTDEETDYIKDSKYLKRIEKLKKEKGLDEQEADKIAIATLQYKQGLTRKNTYNILFDEEKRKEYIRKEKTIKFQWRYVRIMAKSIYKSNWKALFIKV